MDDSKFGVVRPGKSESREGRMRTVVEVSEE